MLGWGRGLNLRSVDRPWGAVRSPELGAQTFLMYIGRGQESIVTKRMLDSRKQGRKVAIQVYFHILSSWNFGSFDSFLSQP